MAECDEMLKRRDVYKWEKEKDHVRLGKEYKLLEQEGGSQVSGPNFYFFANEAALLELALVNWATLFVASKGFTPILTPDVAKNHIIEACGFAPRGSNTTSQVYNIEGTDTSLVATAEITLAGLYYDRILSIKETPVKLVGFSHCFRPEVGSGQYSRGIYRLHQFSKVEMFAISTPEKSEEMHSELLDVQKQVCDALGLSCRVVDMASGDLGAPAYRKFDVEAFMPSRGGYGEISSTSNCTDFQSRRLEIRYQKAVGQNVYTHTLNGTALAVPRVLIAILENNLRSDGSIDIPNCLVPFMGGIDKIKPASDLTLHDKK